MKILCVPCNGAVIAIDLTDRSSIHLFCEDWYTFALCNLFSVIERTLIARCC